MGDVLLDEFFSGTVERISPEAPVPVVNINNHFYRLGGAGNVIANLKSLGASVDILGFIGGCDVSEKIMEKLSDLGCNNEFLFSTKEMTMPKKTRVFSGNQQLIRFDIETVRSLSDSLENDIITCFSRICNDYDIVVFSDYGKGFLSNSLTQNIIKESKKAGIRVLVDPKGSDYSKYHGAYIITPNKKEIELATGIDISDEATLSLALDELKKVSGVKIAMATLSEDGIAYKKEKGNLEISKTKARAVYDVTGAGDTVVAALSFSLAVGQNIYESVEFANYAAGLVVEQPGVAIVKMSDVVDFKENYETKETGKILETSELKATGQRLREQQKKIIFTNGCFDILHLGHVDYMRQSAELGDILVVGVNSDSSVKKLKGDDRPINCQEDRALVLASLGFVDYVIIFEEETPQKVIELLRPNILTKGSDWASEEVVGKDMVEKVVLMPILDGRSTTGTIKKIGLKNVNPE